MTLRHCWRNRMPCNSLSGLQKFWQVAWQVSFWRNSFLIQIERPSNTFFFPTFFLFLSVLCCVYCHFCIFCTTTFTSYQEANWRAIFFFWWTSQHLETSALPRGGLSCQRSGFCQNFKVPSNVLFIKPQESEAKPPIVIGERKIVATPVAVEKSVEMVLPPQNWSPTQAVKVSWNVAVLHHGLS